MNYPSSCQTSLVERLLKEQRRRWLREKPFGFWAHPIQQGLQTPKEASDGRKETKTELPSLSSRSVVMGGGIERSSLQLGGKRRREASERDGDARRGGVKEVETCVDDAEVGHDYPCRRIGNAGAHSAVTARVYSLDDDGDDDDTEDALKKNRPAASSLLKSTRLEATPAPAVARSAKEDHRPRSFFTSQDLCTSSSALSCSSSHDLFEWELSIPGLKGSQWAGRNWLVRLSFPHPKPSTAANAYDEDEDNAGGHSDKKKKSTGGFGLGNCGGEDDADGPSHSSPSAVAGDSQRSRRQHYYPAAPPICTFVGVAEASPPSLSAPQSPLSPLTPMVTKSNAHATTAAVDSSAKKPLEVEAEVEVVEEGNDGKDANRSKACDNHKDLKADGKDSNISTAAPQPATNATVVTTSSSAVRVADNNGSGDVTEEEEENDWGLLSYSHSSASPCGLVAPPPPRLGDEHKTLSSFQQRHDDENSLDEFVVASPVTEDDNDHDSDANKVAGLGVDCQSSSLNASIAASSATTAAVTVTVAAATMPLEDEQAKRKQNSQHQQHEENISFPFHPNIHPNTGVIYLPLLSPPPPTAVNRDANTKTSLPSSASTSASHRASSSYWNPDVTIREIALAIQQVLATPSLPSGQEVAGSTCCVANDEPFFCLVSQGAGVFQRKLEESLVHLYGKGGKSEEESVVVDDADDDMLNMMSSPPEKKKRSEQTVTRDTPVASNGRLPTKEEAKGYEIDDNDDDENEMTLLEGGGLSQLGGSSDVVLLYERKSSGGGAEAVPKRGVTFVEIDSGEAEGKQINGDEHNEKRADDDDEAVQATGAFLKREREEADEEKGEADSLRLAHELFNVDCSQQQAQLDNDFAAALRLQEAEAAAERRRQEEMLLEDESIAGSRLTPEYLDFFENGNANLLLCTFISAVNAAVETPVRAAQLLTPRPPFIATIRDDIVPIVANNNNNAVSTSSTITTRAIPTPTASITPYLAELHRLSLMLPTRRELKDLIYPTAAPSLALPISINPPPHGGKASLYNSSYFPTTAPVFSTPFPSNAYPHTTAAAQNFAGSGHGWGGGGGGKGGAVFSPQPHTNPQWGGKFAGPLAIADAGSGSNTSSYNGNTDHADKDHLSKEKEAPSPVVFLHRHLSEKNMWLPALYEWVVASNESYLIRIAESRIMPEFGTIHQYLMMVHDVESEREFRKKRSERGTCWLFHGSAGGNWHSILRNGLMNMSGTIHQLHGAAHGQGVYFAAQAATSLGYSYSKALPSTPIVAAAAPSSSASSYPYPSPYVAPPSLPIVTAFARTTAAVSAAAAAAQQRPAKKLTKAQLKRQAQQVAFQQAIALQQQQQGKGGGKMGKGGWVPHAYAPQTAATNTPPPIPESSRLIGKDIVADNPIDPSTMTCLALCEVLNDAFTIQNNDYCRTVTDPTAIKVRFLFVYPSGRHGPSAAGIDMRVAASAAKVQAVFDHYVQETFPSLE